MANKKKPTVVSLFAGCGGFDLGFKQAGYTIIWANEIDPWAGETYRCNIGNHIQIDDIRNIDISKIPKADVVIGGIPCQSFSIAGKRLGLKDTRGTLFYEYAKVVKAVQPKAFVIENVKGLVNHDGGNTLKAIISVMESFGYIVSYKVLNASDFGVPQNRERVFIVGIKSDQFKFPLAMSKETPTVKETIDDLVGKENTFHNHEPMKHTKRIVERFKTIKQGKGLKDVPDKHKQRKRGDATKISGKTYYSNNRRLIEDQPAPTICASFQSNFIHYSQHRNLTAREAARLQGFPDTFVFKGKRTTMSWEKYLSQYQQIGNAVPPPLAKVIAKSLKKYVK